jgi:hypothetical protein
MVDGEWRSAKCDASARVIFKLDPADPVNVAAGALGPWVTHDLITVQVEGEGEGDGPMQLPNIPCSEIKVTAHASNTHPVYFGDADVNSTDVPPWNAREGELLTRTTNANEHYVVAAAGHTGQKLHLQTRSAT